MNLFKLTLLSIFCILLIFTGCKKDDESVSTSLELRFIDQLGNSVTDATVKLYKSPEDLQSQQNQLGKTLTSDKTGKVLFRDLESTQYFWFAEKGCQNNINTIITTTDPLESGKIKIVTSTLIETGNLELINESSGQYDVYINGYPLLTADPYYSYSFFYVPAGSYSIRILQVGGSGDMTYNRDITCGSTLTVTFP